MANRILRDWTDSDKINSLSVHSERFFTRLIMKVDDYGCFYADTRLLKANLFPLLLDVIREADLLRWMAECQKAGLIVLYESNSKKYLQISDFKQRLRTMNAKFPLPSDGGQMSVNCPPEVETKPEVETEVEDEKNASLALVFNKKLNPIDKKNKKKFTPPEFEEFENYCLENGFDKNLAKKAFEYYASANWKDSRGNQVNSWKQKLISVWFKDENKPQKNGSHTVNITKNSKDAGAYELASLYRQEIEGRA